MIPSEYNAYVARIEERARLNPALVRKRADLLVAVGYVYVIGILLLVIGAGVALVYVAISSRTGAFAVKLLIPLGVLAWLIVKSLWVTTQPPAGIVLQPGSAPQLFERIEQIRDSLSAPRADTVLITDEFNASVSQIARLGIFGWPKTYITLGLPLLFALDKEQFDAVLAHEFAHLSSAHPKRGLWIYRVSRTWRALLSQLEQSRNWGGRLFESFVAWYHPRLHAHGFVLSRNDEYEADADAARVTSSSALASALIALEVREPTLIDRFWSDLWKTAATEPTPPAHSWTALPAAMRDVEVMHEQSNELARALRRRALSDETHPSLADRLNALGVAAKEDSTEAATQLLAPLRTSAGEHYLHGTEVLETFERQWRDVIDEPWAARHKALKEYAARRTELERQDGDDQALGPEDAFELAEAVLELDGIDAALPLLHRVLVNMPGHVGANFLVGRQLLADGDAGGVPHLEHVMAADSTTKTFCNELLQRFFAIYGNHRDVEAVQQTQYEHEQLMRAAGAERDDVGRNDVLVAFELSSVASASLQQVGEAIPRVDQIWIARKVTELLPERPMLVVVVAPRRWKAGLGGNAQKLAHEVLAKLQLGITADIMVVALTSSTSWLYKKVKKIEGSSVYQRRT